jgi:hypothetical protein
MSEKDYDDYSDNDNDDNDDNDYSTGKIDDLINEHISGDVHTPDSIAWKLLVDENFVDLGENKGQLIGFLEQGEINDKLEATAIEFEILITIYLEMVIGWYKLLYLMENPDGPEFKLDLTNIKIDDLTNPFKEKMLVLGYILNVTEFKNLEIYEEFKKKSYCRVALRNLKEDEGFFIMNKKNIPNDKLYHFILNSNFKSVYNLREIYAIIKINNIGYKINFVKSQ